LLIFEGPAAIESEKDVVTLQLISVCFFKYFHFWYLVTATSVLVICFSVVFKTSRLNINIFFV